MDDASKVLGEWKFDQVCVTETHLRENVQMEGEMFELIEKGRKKQVTHGGTSLYSTEKAKILVE